MKKRNITIKYPNREKTASLPHRIMKITSIYLAKQDKVDREDFCGYESIVILPENASITIRSGTKITPKDGRVFEYVLAQWQATKKKQKDLDYLEVNIPLILKALKYSNRTENRRKVIQHLRNMTSVTIIYKKYKHEVIFHTLETIEIIDKTKTIAIKLSDTYTKALTSAKERFINVERAMELNSTYAIELSKLLQMDGCGVNKNTGKPIPVKRIYHERICNFLHLPSDLKTSMDTISRAFRILNEEINFPRYSYNGYRKIWENLIK